MNDTGGLRHLNSRFGKRLIWGVAVMGFVSSCAQDSYRSARAMAPVPAKTLALMSDQGMEPGAPILMRAFKKESEIEVWKQGRDGKYALLKTYPICRWSGQLGPRFAKATVRLRRDSTK
jgi:murein L,D-transpeptidase YafK